MDPEISRLQGRTAAPYEMFEEAKSGTLHDAAEQGSENVRHEGNVQAREGEKKAKKLDEQSASVDEESSKTK